MLNAIRHPDAEKEHARLGAAFLVALALHVGALAAVAFWPSREDRSPPGEQEITIDLAPAMEQAEAVAAAAVSAPAEVLAEAEEAEPPELVVTERTPPEEATEILEAEPLESVAPVADAETAEAVPVDAVPAEAPVAAEPEVVAALPPPRETVIAKELEAKPAPKPVPPPAAPKKPPPKPRPVPREAVAERRSAPSVPREGQASSSRENTGGAAAAADPNAFNRYAAQLAAALRGRLRYPEAARSQGLTGVTTVRFTMQRSGRILSATVVRSAGHGLLDEAALAAAAPGNSLPAAPDAVPQQQLTFVVPLRFNLR
ncbi:TonB family protein [Microvirga subterranea]|uniref:Protein TonB n=1 Tax=Microvirga subterranea TaxID=186651 RepID=A0A370HLF0_9HYPH|nr:TonB family protein [Microvirga subterranea]RDI58881.1 protein TonB [Microvirga subterranea]